MNFKLYACCWLLLLSQWAWAQTGILSGVITDGQSGEALPGVNIRVLNTTRGVVTDMDGRYQLQATAGETIRFSYIGYLEEEVTLGNQSTLNVVLMPDIETLGEIVVVGYGTQQKKDITGAVSVVDNKDFESRPNTQIASLIQGKAAGVQVLSSSGKPGAGFNIRIRGTNSISSSSEPLYVVDGVPTSDTRSLNPADIESISILKDASSAAIYGAQGANGVVLITTKKGEGKPTVSLEAYRGFSSMWNTLKVLNGEQYQDLMTELGQNTDWTRYSENTDWQNEIFRQGTSQNYQLSLSGKSNKTTYYLSGGWVQQEGAVRSAEMDRFNFKVNLGQQVNDWLNVGTNMLLTRYADVDVTDNQNVNSGGVILGVLTTPPVIGIFNEDGTYTSNPFQNWENPVSGTDASIRGYKNQRILGNLFAELEPLKGLKFKSNFGIDQSNATSDYFLDPYTTSYGRAMKGIGRYNTWISSYYIWDNMLSYNKQLGEHKFGAMLGSALQKTRYEDSNMERRNFPSGAITTPGAGSEIISANQSESEVANASLFSRITYDYGDRYLMTANFRRDGSSKFGPSKRFGYFPSFSLGWRISEEAFLQQVQALTDLKLRFGWGIVGNDNLPSRYGYRGLVGSGANYPIGGEIMPGSYPASIENKDLKWEESEQTNIGLDLAILNSRITFTADAYLKHTRDLLLYGPLPKSTGFDNALQNIGSLKNKGLEFQLGTRNLVGTLKWNTDLNLSFNRNEVVDIVGQELFAGFVTGRDNAIMVKEGLPLGTFYGYLAGGVDPETGMLYYITKDGESTFEPAPEDRTIIGNANPDFQYGITNTLSYKGLGLSVFLQGSQGNDILNATRIETEGMMDPKNQSADVVNRWRQPGDVTDMPRAVWGSTANSRISTRFIEDRSYLRVKAATLSYDLPESLIGRAKLGNVRVYATGENLLTFTRYKGFDPEVNAFGDNNLAQGVDYGTYPQVRNIIFGLNISF